MRFDELDLSPEVVKGVAGYEKATEIQTEAIPHILSGVDVRASAQTGTGKTAAFLLPALSRLGQGEKGGPRLVILAPTRELAMQITVQAEKYAQHMKGIKTVCVVGGVPYPVQTKKLMRPYDILIATPGRLIDFMDRRKVNFSRVEMLVLDEADRMLDMGFTEPVERIVKATPPSRQTLLFSATLQGSVRKLSDRLMKNPVEIVTHAEKARHENIDQKLHYVDNLNHKTRLLDHILQDAERGDAIIFTATKRHADKLASELRDKGEKAGALHGDMNQRARSRTLALLRGGKINVLVATDVAARGIDVQSITHVINFDLPNSVEDYVHRIGRTGRAGATGTALSFAASRDTALVKRIESFTGHPITVSEIAGLEPKPSKPRPSRPFRKGTRPKKKRFFSSKKPRNFPKSVK